MADTLYIVQTAGEIIIGLLSIVGNGIVILLIIKSSPLQTVTNYFVASLATADLLVGAVGMPCVLVSLNLLPHHFYGCLAVNSVIVILTQISINGLLMIAIERFVAIKHPFTYVKYGTGRNACIAIMLSWIIAVIIGLTPLFGWNLGDSEYEKCTFVMVIDMEYMVYFLFCSCILIPLACMLVIYSYIYSVVRHQLRQIASLQVGQGNNSQIKSMKADIKAAKWFAVVILLFAVSWLPIHIINTITFFHGYFSPEALVTAILLSHLNSAINPILYALGNKKFNVAWRKLLNRQTRTMRRVEGPWFIKQLTMCSQEIDI